MFNSVYTYTRPFMIVDEGSVCLIQYIPIQDLS
jgi:hypothetical protein